MNGATERTLPPALPFLVAMLPFAILVAAHWGMTPPAWAGDYAQYLMHAQALADGRPYADIGYLYHPAAWAIAPPAFPPALPLTLVPVVAAFGTDPDVLRAVALAPLVAFAWLAYRRLGRALSPVVAAVAVGCAALSIEAQLGVLRPLTDPPFAALVWGTCLLADRDGAWSWSRVLGVMGLGFAAIAYRVAGVVLLPALLLYAWHLRREAGWRPALPALAWGAVGVGALATGLAANPYADGMRGSWLLAAHRVGMLVDNYGSGIAATTARPLGTGIGGDAWQVVSAVLLVLGLPALVRALRGTLTGWVAVWYLLMLLTAPVGELRYLWPLSPLVVAGVVLGAGVIVDRVRGPAPGMAIGVAGALLLVAGLVSALLTRPERTLEGNPDAEAMFAFVRAQPGARVLFHNPRVLALRTGRPAMGLLDRTTPGQLAGIDERHLTHFVWQRPDISHCAQLVANALVAAYPERFRLAYSNATFRVYAVVPAATPFIGPFEAADWTKPDRFCPGLASR